MIEVTLKEIRVLRERMDSILHDLKLVRTNLLDDGLDEEAYSKPLIEAIMEVDDIIFDILGDWLNESEGKSLDEKERLKKWKTWATAK